MRDLCQEAASRVLRLGSKCEKHGLVRMRHAKLFSLVKHISETPAQSNVGASEWIGGRLGDGSSNSIGEC